MPGCIVATKTSGFSAAKNSKIFALARFAEMYDESPGRCAAGINETSLITARKAAFGRWAVGRKVLAANKVPLTLT
ncbi:hypothetical protein RRF57_008066 [Xylaria bambusicola]|uniref:Uncharacterized protein n=1 Tax=Xylaria bambusicola TaxID=326684 RepID=A0AAN7UM63_9PEZI